VRPITHARHLQPDAVHLGPLRRRRVLRRNRLLDARNLAAAWALLDTWVPLAIPHKHWRASPQPLRQRPFNILVVHRDGGVQLRVCSQAVHQTGGAEHGLPLLDGHLQRRQHRLLELVCQRHLALGGRHVASLVVDHGEGVELSCVDQVGRLHERKAIGAEETLPLLARVLHRAGGGHHRPRLDEGADHLRLLLQRHLRRIYRLHIHPESAVQQPLHCRPRRRHGLDVVQVHHRPTRARAAAAEHNLCAGRHAVAGLEVSHGCANDALPPEGVAKGGAAGCCVAHPGV
jgi:hypothetical protein